MKRIFNPNNLTYAYSDGSGLETKEWRLRRYLIIDKAIELGIEGKRIWSVEFEKINKLFEDKKIYNNQMNRVYN
jgi:hypothetical protein